MNMFTKYALKSLLTSFLVSVVIYSFSAAMLSQNFIHTILPAVKHVLSHHLWQMSSAIASGIPADNSAGTVNALFTSYQVADSPGLFMVIWAWMFLYLLFAKYSGFADTGYISPLRTQYYLDKGQMGDWG